MHRLALLAALALPACKANEKIHGIAYVAPAFGNVSHKTYGAAPNLSDSTSGTLISALVQATGDTAGAGAAIEVMQSDDDLHVAGVSLEQLDLFPFLAATAEAKTARVSVRGGPFFTSTELGDGTASLDSFSWGGRFALAPEFDLSRSDGHHVSAFGVLAAGLGSTEIETSTTTATLTWASTNINYGIDIGVRAAFPNALVSLAYVYRNLNVGESEVTASTVVKEADYSFSGVQLSFGVRW